MDNVYYVYIHTFPNNKIYIGMTGQKPKSRFDSGWGYINQPVMWNAIMKYGWRNIKSEILFENLTLDEANNKEIELIAFYKSKDRKYGYNVENGGSSNGKHGEETLRKMSEAVKSRTKEFWVENGLRIKNSIRHRQGVKNNAIEKRKPVSQYTLNGKYIKTYESAKEAERQLNIKSSSGIISCCKGKYKTAKGFIWKYENDLLDIENYRIIKGFSKAVLQIDKNTKEIINKYDSLIEAERKTRVSVSNISTVCRGKTQTAGGFRWEYANKSIPRVIIKAIEKK